MHATRLLLSLAALETVMTCARRQDPLAASKRLPVSNNSPLVPWMQPLNWTPAWKSLSDDLPGLAKERASGSSPLAPQGWVTLFVFALPEPASGSPEEASLLRLMLNTIYSYIVFGGGSFDIVGCLTPASLAWCAAFRLPCLNATRYLPDPAKPKAVGWAKFRLTRDVLKLGYSVHLSDLDVTYLKPVLPAVRVVMSWSDGVADGSMMTEEWVYQDRENDPTSRRPIYLANTGVVFLRANERSLAFIDSLLAYGDTEYQDQYVATWVSYKSWAPCGEEATCMAVRGRRMAAITRHPAQFPHSNCDPEPRYAHCASRRLYVHAVCRATSRDKERFLRSLHAVFIKDAPGGAAAAAAAPAAWGQQDGAALAAAGLPCPAAAATAWLERYYTSYTSVDTPQSYTTGVGTAGAAAGVEGNGTSAESLARLNAGAAALAEQQQRERQAQVQAQQQLRMQPMKRQQQHHRQRRRERALRRL